MRRLAFVVPILLALAAPGAARAAFFPAELIDGPSPDIVEVGDLDIARDGQGAVVYTKREAGVQHAFVSMLSDGVFQPPARVAPTATAPSSQPVVSASQEGRLAVAWISEGTLYAAFRARRAQTLGGPATIATGGVTNPSIDMSVNGVTYLSWTQNGDVRVARSGRDTSAWDVVPTVMDIEPGAAAGTGSLLRSRISASADGTGLVVWGEQGSDGRTHVFSRRLFELRPSAAPRDLTLSAAELAGATGADSPELEIEDDSSFAQVVFRQNTTAGPRVVMRRLVGSDYDPPVPVDQGAFATGGRVDITGRGEGMYGVSGAAGEALGGAIWNNRFDFRFRLDAGNGVSPSTTAAIGENESGAVAYMQGTGPGDVSVRARYITNVDKPAPEPDVVISRPEFGTVDTAAGIDFGSTASSDVAFVFVQTGAEGRRLVAGVYDRPPNRPLGLSTSNKRSSKRLRWSTSTNRLGSVVYRVFVDGTPIGDSTVPELRPAPGAIRDGTHRWQIAAIDRRGQEARSPTRILRVDNTPPRLSVAFIRSGRTVSVRARGRDARGRSQAGLARMVVDWGPGRARRLRYRASHRYSRAGTYTIRVTAIDKATNRKVATRRVTIG